MSETWHKIVDGSIADTVRVTTAPEGIATGPDGNPVWRIDVRDDPPLYDPITQTLDPTTIIEATQVRQGWRVLEKPLDDAKRAASDEVNAGRIANETNGFLHDGHTWQSDERSVIRLQQVRGKAEIVEERAPGTFSTTVRTKDNQNITYNYTQLSALYEAMNDHYQLVFDGTVPHKDQIAAATTNEEIRAIMAGLGGSARGRKKR